MLIIRQEQMEVLKEYMTKRFEDLMVSHLNVYFSKECQALGEEEVRKKIRDGIDQAKTHGIMIERDVSRYINLILLFGSNFDKDPAFPWAGNILKDESIGGPSQRMNMLYEEAAKHIDDAT